MVSEAAIPFDFEKSAKMSPGFGGDAMSEKQAPNAAKGNTEPSPGERLLSGEVSGDARVDGG